MAGTGDGLADASPPLAIDIVSDVVCPWCVIGARQLAKALALKGVAATIAWRPFELNPDMPEGGEDLREHVARKYGATPECSDQTRAQIEALGRELGFDFRYGDGVRIYNTFLAHQLLAWAGETEGRTALKNALFRAYFTQGAAIDQIDALLAAVRVAGLDADEASSVLSDGRYADQVRSEERFWVEAGVQGVPAMIFDRRAMMIGAQGVEQYMSALDDMMALRQAEARAAKAE